MLILKILGVLCVVSLFAFGKYYQTRSIENQKDHKADVETLFNGRK